jgi:PAS domain S-box-containing protein
MVAALDEQGRIIAWNQECERVTGYQAQEIIGNSDWLKKLYPGDARRDEIRARLGKEYRNWDLLMTCKDGSSTIVRWTNISRQHPIPGWAEWAIGVEVGNSPLGVVSRNGGD